ncbi:MAG: CvpA family protein [Oxalobacter sp.]|nr:CvpA family protein [Oxalobacter sp.]
MTWFDILLVLLVGGLMLRSTVSGAIREAASLAGWVIAFYVATHFGDAVAPWLPRSMTEGTAGAVILFLVMFIGTRILVWLAGRMARGMVSAVGLSSLDRLLGAAFGFCKGMVIAVALVLVAGLTDLPQKPFWQDAMFSPVMVALAKQTMPFLPDYLARQIHF